MIRKLLVLGGLGFLAKKAWDREQEDANGVAFAKGEPEGTVRNAGADAQGDKPKTWSKTDEELDESFPASDPPANY